MKIMVSFIGPPPQNQRAEAQDRWDPETHKHAFVFAPREPQGNGKQKGNSCSDHKAKFGPASSFHFLPFELGSMTLY